MKKRFTKYPSNYIRASYYYDADADDISVADIVIGIIYDTYQKAKQLPKPDQQSKLNSYYGSTPMYAVYGNRLELIDDAPCEVSSYGTTFRYDHAWAIRIGGAYDTDITNELRKYIRDHRKELLDEGYAILDSYGWGYSTYGIAKKR